MNFRRNLVIGGGIIVAAAATMASGPPAAQAQSSTTAAISAPATPSGTENELTELRANQQLLQRRLDQLEQIAQVGVAHPHLPTGTASLAGSFPRSFLIPGTDTSIAIGGRVILSATEFFHGGNPNTSNGSNTGSYGTASIPGLPLNGSAASKRSNDVFYMNSQESRLFFETRTPTALGEAKTYIEFDFHGCTASGTNCSGLTTFVNPLLPRLRLAYATLGPWMFGQNWGIGTDLAAFPEAFDFTGIVGTWGRGRVPEASYTFAIPTIAGNASLQVGLMMPVATMSTPQGEIANDTNMALGINGGGALGENPLKNEWPQPAFALTWHQPWGHVQLHADLQEYYLNDGLFLNRSYLGGGGGASGSFKLWGRDNLGWSVSAGKGESTTNSGGGPGNWFSGLVSNFGGAGAGCYGAVASVSCPGGGVNTAATAGLVKVALPGSFNANLNYQHWWTPTVRSTFNIGYQDQTINTTLIGSDPKGVALLGSFYNRSEILGLANLIWSPVPFVDTGFEFFYGARQTFSHARGSEIGLDYNFVMKF